MTTKEELNRQAFRLILRSYLSVYELTYAEAAERFDVSASAVGRWVRGESFPRRPIEKHVFEIISTASRFNPLLKLRVAAAFVMWEHREAFEKLGD